MKTLQLLRETLHREVGENHGMRSFQAAGFQPVRPENRSNNLENICGFDDTGGGLAVSTGKPRVPRSEERPGAAHSRRDHSALRVGGEPGQPRSTLSLEYVALAPKCTQHQHTVAEYIALAPEVFAAFPLVVEFLSHTLVVCAAPAHVVDHIAQAPTRCTA